MSKPLELTIYPPAEKEPTPSDPDWLGWDDWRAWDRANTYELHERAGKRFTNAELAAEWHANEVEAWRMVSRRPEFYNVDVAEKLEARESTLRRFATHPHYFEATEPESDTE